jgi:hypothetical protein
MDGRELLEGAAAFKAAVDVVRSVWPMLHKKIDPLPPGCPGPNFMPVYRLVPRPTPPIESDDDL